MTGLAGAIGLEIVARQGRIHSEGFTDFSVAEDLRPLLWDRIHSVAANHGLLRLWAEEQAPFWSHCGLVKADAEALTKLPIPWQGPRTGWWTLRLRDDLETILATEQEFALFMEAERERTKRVFRRATLLKWLAVLVAFAVLVLAMDATFYLIHRRAQLHGP